MQTTLTDSAFRASWRAFSKSENDIGFGDIRGSINGGGDFIYLPRPAGNKELIFLSIGTGRSIQYSGNRPYLGVQVQESGSGAIIKMVQKTSPAEQAGLAIGDTVTSVSGTPVDTQNTLAALIGQHAGGDQVELGIIRNGAPQSATVTLAELLPPMIVTPSAEITLNDQTDIVVDIGFNGVTGVLVLADTAHVREPVTGSEVDVPAGSAVVVVPGDKIGVLIPVSDSDIHAWWQNTSTTPVTPESPMSTAGSTLLVLVIGAGCLCVVVIVLIVVIVLVTRKKKQPPASAPPYYPPQR
jgi:membrane-associated protease RseP (regulator of RpoE activity)